MIRTVLLLFSCLPGPAMAMNSWVFGDVVTVSDAGEAGYFHHLDGAGRTHLAASASEVALTWEDDSGGAPQVYLSIKPHEAAAFSRTYRISKGEEAYEPSIAPLDGDRWLAAWEQDGAIVACVIDADGPGPIGILAPKGGRQVTLATNRNGRIAAVWAREQDRGQLIEAALLQVDERHITLVSGPTIVAPIEEHAFQGYPAATWAGEGRLVVAWEDRRAGHTRLFHAWSDSWPEFAPERQLNEHSAPVQPLGEDTGLGSGVMRVVLATGAAGTVRAIWLDKRNPASGYAVWGAASGDAGVTFGPNEIVQDELGAAVPQWHPALAAGISGFAAAWDDTREGWGDTGEPGDILLSWNFGGGWSADLVVPGASGDGYQGSPAIAIDPHGDLHLIWIDRVDLESPTRLHYLHGTFTPQRIAPPPDA